MSVEITEQTKAMSTPRRRPRRPLSRRIQPRVMGIVNLPMRRVLALPFATPLGNRLMLAYLTGRKTGRSYRQPVSYVRHGENLLTPGGGDWKLNLVEGQPARIRLRGRDVLARPEIISNSDDVERLLGVMTETNSMAGRFVRVPRGSDRRFDGEKLEAALRYGFRIIRWHLEEPGAPASSSSAPKTAAVET
jgi:hypothetical protein